MPSLGRACRCSSITPAAEKITADAVRAVLP
jgi:hypothetical protein